MHPNQLEIIPLIGTGVWLCWRYILVPMLSQAIGGWLKDRLVRTEHEAALWLRHKHKAMGKKID